MSTKQITWHQLPRDLGHGVMLDGGTLIVLVKPVDGPGYHLQFKAARVGCEGQSFAPDVVFATVDAAKDAVPRYLDWARPLVDADRAAMLQRLEVDRRRKALGPGWDDAPPMEDPFEGLL